MIHNLKGRRIFYILAAVFCVALLAGAMLAVNVMAAGPGGQGQQISGKIQVYWDTISTTYNNDGDLTGITALNSTAGIESVTISGGSATNNGTVAHEDGTKSRTSDWTATTTEITRTSGGTVTVTITPADGYYVTFITICCTSSGSPAQCQTYGKGEAFNASYSISNAGTISVSVPLDEEEGFYHNGGTNPYFILIAVKEIPSPLYVEYDYGNIVTYIKDYNDANNTELFSSTFTESADTWTDTYEGNVYGTTDEGVTNGVMTADTQYKYTYSKGSTSAEAGWKHYANSITDGALAEAAAAGYYFVGWEATYYTNCTEGEKSEGSNNNYTYTFSTKYGSTTDYYQPGDSVGLTVHVRLVAQWVKVDPTPGKLTITKTFEGLDSSEYPESITYTVKDSSENVVTDGTGMLTSSNGWSATIGNLNPGTYTVTESGYDVDGYNCTTTTSVTVGSDGAVAGSSTEASVALGYTVTKTYNESTNTYSYTVTTYDATVAFTNTYTKKTENLTVYKYVTGNMGDKTKTFSISVADSTGKYTGNGNLSDYTTNNSESNTISVSSVPVGTVLTVTESNYGSYSVTVEYGHYNESGEWVANTSEVSSSDGSYTITVTEGDDVIRVTNNYEITVDTGVVLESIPYIAILAVVVIGGVVLLRRRSKDED